MLEMHKNYLLKLVGAGEEHCKQLDAAKWSDVSRNRLFITSSVGAITPARQSPPFEHGFTTLPVNSELHTRKLPPWMLPRGITYTGNVVKSAVAYHPDHLLYDSEYFGGLSELWKLVQKNGLRTTMEKLIPPTYQKAFKCLAEWDQKKQFLP